jgi:hypothetical protein
MGLADQLTAERSAWDYKPNLGWQKYLGGGPLAATVPEVGRYGTACH